MTSLALVAAPLAAEDSETFLFGGDVFRAGQTVMMDVADADDVFLAGETVSVTAPITGTAHMAGRWLTLRAAVGDGLYAAGQTLSVEAPVTGDASLAGQKIDIREPVSGDLRVFGSEITIDAPVAGSLVAAGEFVSLNAAVDGDMAVTARSLDFGTGAAIAGQLILFEEDPGTLEIPESVAPADRIDRREIEAWERDYARYNPVRPRNVVLSFLTGVLIVTVVAAAVAALAPETMARLRRTVLDAPGRSLATGFVTVSALVGSGIVLGLTLIGLLLLPAAIFLALAAGFAGYVIGAYALGVGILSASGRHDPASTGDRALAAGVGALAAGLVGLVPFVGWLAMVALVLAGAGALCIQILRPRLFSPV
ncbi:hypothetical protein KUH32_09350 [Thalassococcus sp. CAU 1522]|uniref:DUF8173 domain-containing protein n=2 Tax=Thalassococcus arenae TaxID=2851652 RepID=A0ABS6N7I6_9RHOB|nr:hypothetical protein [Thalassococcus arenae]